jgi:gliding motility-associated-like protein
LNAVPKTTGKSVAMKNALATLALMIMGMTARAQFTNKESIPLADTLQPAALEWVDIDNDSLLDVMIVATNAGGLNYLLFYKRLDSTFEIKAMIPTRMRKIGYSLADYDLDNRIDVIISGIEGSNNGTKVLLNAGNFGFGELPLVPERGGVVKLADLDMDGKKELILSRDDNAFFTKIYKYGSGTWRMVNDSLKVYASNLLLDDFDGDMDNDIFLSGTKPDGSPVQTILFNEGNFVFTPGPEKSAINAAAVTKADINYDGILDVLICGTDPAGQPQCRFFISTDGRTFIQQDTTLSTGVVQSLFAADLNSDGKPELNLLFNDGNELINIIRSNENGQMSLPAANLIAQRFGDADRDGDLDLIQLQPGNFTYYENQEQDINRAPGKPSNPIGVMIYNRLFLYWDKPTDDRTPQSSITYDLTLQGPDNQIVIGEFDLFNHRRTTVSRGNMGFNNFTLLNNIPPAQYNYFIQAVDNAFHAGPQGVCHGSSLSCSELVTEEIEACKEEKLMLSDGQNALWFSFKVGYLGNFETYPYDESDSDTLFSMVPGKGSACASIKIYNIHRVNQLTKTNAGVKYACEGALLHLEAENSWKDISWSSASLGFISKSPSIDFTVTAADTIRVALSDGTGCLVRRETAIALSHPEINISDEAYQIVKGESVHLNIRGGVQYTWSPGTGLDQTDIPDPVATPVATTEYNVVVKDTLGCATQAKILIIVEETAFIPNLFTPNEDGKNDLLRIYGLSNIMKFSFSIYNREGSLVYKTNDIKEATITGWNGSVRGILQPAGVYHWKVQGKYNNGGRLLLNGKETGSIVLIR